MASLTLPSAVGQMIDHGFSQANAAYVDRYFLALLAVAMLTSKGASGVTGAGFITLAATLAVVPSVPVAALSLILGIDRFMSEARALTNLIGNAVAAIAISHSEGDLNRERLITLLHRR